MAAIMAGILVGVGGLLMGGLAMAVMAIVSRVLGLYRNVAGTAARAKTAMGSAGARIYHFSDAEIERLPEESHHVEEPRLAA